MNYQDSLGNWEEIILEPSGDTLPIGAITQFSGETAPTNWLLCNGQAISRTDYAELFDVIGTTYGIGDGSSTFNLPDLRGRVPVGLKSSDASFDALGETGGEKNHTLTIDEIPPHIHDLTNEGHTTIVAGYVYRTTGNNFPVQNEGYAIETAGSKGGGQAHNILQPYIVTNYIIKAKQSIGIVGTVTNDITDVNNDAVPNCKTVKDYVDSKQTYSTTETVIGTYNNKPLYRKTFIGTYTHNSVLVSNVAVLVNVYGSGKHEGGSNIIRAVPYYEYWNGTSFILTVNMPDGGTDVVLSSRLEDENVSANINITLEYTKTTD